MADQLWRKGQSVDDWVIRFTVGNDHLWDQRLLPFDVEASRAHVNGLAGAGILNQEETDSIQKAFDRLLDDYRDGVIVVQPEDEDCHTVIENYLTQHLGDTGKKVHTGRSRNDQVLAALRLYIRSALGDIAATASELCETLIRLGEETDRWPLPGYTHTRQAMPSSVGAWALGYAELLIHDLSGLLTTRDRINRSPLGSAAGYGVPYLALRRDAVAGEAGFSGIQRHVTSVQLSRGKSELEVVHALAQLALTMNRIASDLILYSTSEFGFVSIAVNQTTGSSIMPQKQNPDVLELVRGHYHRIQGEMQVLASLPSGLMSGYHRDLQLTKESVMRSLDVAADCARALRSTIPELEWDEDRLREAFRSDTMATHAAIDRVAGGEAFRDAYRAAADSESALDPDQALDGYTVAGYPGRGVPSELREALQRVTSGH